MSKVTMPEPVAWMTKDGRAATKETKDSAMATPSKLAFSVALITTDQAEAYANARVREALEGVERSLVMLMQKHTSVRATDAITAIRALICYHYRG